METIPVVFTSSAFYAPYMAVTIQSLMDHSNDTDRYELIILNKEISESTQDQIRKMVQCKSNFSVRFIEVTHALDDHDFNFREGYSSESFYRVVMVEILREYDKVVYLDCDLILLHDIAELYKETDIDDNLVAAAIDIDGLASAFSNHDGRKEYMINYLGIKDLHDYLQSGVMIFNLKAWRDTFTIQHIIDVACDSEVMFGDQDVLNRLCRGRIIFIDMSWNTIINHIKHQLQDLLYLAPTDIMDMYLKARECPKIIHYGGTKPWDVPDCDKAYYFWDVARRTSFYEEIVGRKIEGFKLAEYGI